MKKRLIISLALLLVTVPIATTQILTDTNGGISTRNVILIDADGQTVDGVEGEAAGDTVSGEVADEQSGDTVSGEVTNEAAGDTVSDEVTDEPTETEPPKEDTSDKTENSPDALSPEEIKRQAEAISKVTEQYKGGLKLYAKSAIAIDATTGEILYEKNANKRLELASLTKIMTALLALEKGNMDDKVEITPAALKLMSGSSTAKLKVGEVLTLGDLMYALMLPSGNDAANAIGIHLGGSTWNFVEEMNKKVAELGLKNTNFENAHGLPSGNHFSSAYDIAQITLAAMKYDDFYEYSGRDTYKLPATNTNYAHSFKHAHKMLRYSLTNNSYYNSFAIAGKTGWTPEAGNCYMTVFQYAGRKVVVVVMRSNGVSGAPYLDTTKIFNYAYSILRQADIISK